MRQRLRGLLTFPPPDAGCPAKTHLPGHGATEPGKDTRKSQIYLASLHPGVFTAGMHGAQATARQSGATGTVAAGRVFTHQTVT
ncbi:TPA: hypothetical protein ACIAPS_002780 [Salmonella enterica subsp. enterica serovar Bovismorbificans]